MSKSERIPNITIKVIDQRFILNNWDYDILLEIFGIEAFIEKEKAVKVLTNGFFCLTIVSGGKGRRPKLLMAPHHEPIVHFVRGFVSEPEKKTILVGMSGNFDNLEEVWYPDIEYGCFKDVMIE